MQKRTVTLLIPGLLGPRGVAKIGGALEGLAADELALCLSRAEHANAPFESFEALLFDLFGLSAAQGEDLPVAPLTALVDFDEAPGSFVLRADPVHLQADRDRIVMFGNRQLNVTQAEADQLAEEFNRLFGEDGLRLEVPTPQRWYLRMERPPAIATTPLASVIGEDIHPCLPRGEEALYWHKLLNEVQMLFHGSSVNQARQMRGLPVINSVWFWGGGVLPGRKAAGWGGVWSNELLATALARYFDIAHGGAFSSAEDLLEQCGEGDHLVVLDGAIEAVRFHDIGAWRQFVEGVSSEWLVPLLGAIKQGDVARLNLVCPQAGRYSIEVKALRRWWRRRRPLGHFISGVK